MLINIVLKPNQTHYFHLLYEPKKPFYSCHFIDNKLLGI